MFRNYRLSEEPTPIEQLVGPAKGSSVRKFLPWAILVIFVAVLGIFVIPAIAGAISKARAGRQAAADAESQVQQSREVIPTVPLWEGEVRSSDTLVLTGGGSELRLAIGESGGRLKIDGGTAGDWALMLGEEIYIPGAEGSPAWRLYLKDFGLPGGGGILEIQTLSEVSPEGDLAGAEIASEPPSGQQDRKRDTQVILSAAKPDRYTLDIAFRDFALFRYKLDSQDPLEAYYKDGDNFRLDIGRTVTIWTSNAGAMYAKIGGNEVAIGRRGEVVVKQIRWILNETTGAYDLSLTPLY
jgi:hypothetical protein